MHTIQTTIKNILIERGIFLNSFLFIILVITLGIGCTSSTSRVLKEPAPMNVPANQWENLVGKEVAILGRAEDAKGGAVIITNGSLVWIEDLNFWPDKFFGKKVRVTGIVIQKEDLPVFEIEPGSEQKTGIPVEPGTGIQRASLRYLLGGATWELANE